MRSRDGFSLVEIIIALVLLAVVLIALSGATVRYSNSVTDAELRASALLLANDRLEEVRMHPQYDELDDEFAGVETDVGGIAGASRTTSVDRETYTVGSGVVDITRVSVRVLRPGLRQPVERTIIVGAP